MQKLLLSLLVLLVARTSHTKIEIQLQALQMLVMVNQKAL